MADDLRAGPDSPPTDELRSAEKSFAVLQQVLHGVAADDPVDVSSDAGALNRLLAYTGRQPN